MLQLEFKRMVIYYKRLVLSARNFIRKKDSKKILVYKKINYPHDLIKNGYSLSFFHPFIFFLRYTTKTRQMNKREIKNRFTTCVKLNTVSMFNRILD